MTESELQSVITDAAKLGGWTVAHFRPALTKHGWRTPGQYDAAGWPDLFLVRDGQALAWELKSDKGVVSDDQANWIGLLDQVDGVHAQIVRPHDLDAALDLLLDR